MHAKKMLITKIYINYLISSSWFRLEGSHSIVFNVLICNAVILTYILSCVTVFIGKDINVRSSGVIEWENPAPSSFRTNIYDMWFVNNLIVNYLSMRLTMALIQYESQNYMKFTKKKLIVNTYVISKIIVTKLVYQTVFYHFNGLFWPILSITHTLWWITLKLLSIQFNGFFLLVNGEMH